MGVGVDAVDAVVGELVTQIESRAGGEARGRRHVGDLVVDRRRRRVDDADEFALSAESEVPLEPPPNAKTGIATAAASDAGEGADDERAAVERRRRCRALGLQRREVVRQPVDPSS